MLTVFIRTFIIYISLIIVMRLMGKRQLGELEISDLVTTFLISEIASLPITDSEIPLTHAIIPIIVLLLLEVGISAFLSKFPKLKFIFSARPSTLIKDGELCKKALLDSRISFDELFTQLRQQGCDDISQIKYAILEQNGNITVIQRAKYKPLCPADIDLSVKSGSTTEKHAIVKMDGAVGIGDFLNRRFCFQNESSSAKSYDIHLSSGLDNTYTIYVVGYRNNI